MGKYWKLEKTAQDIYTKYRQICIFAFPDCGVNTIDPDLSFTNHIKQTGHCVKTPDEKYMYHISLAHAYLPAERVVRNTLAHELAHAISERFDHKDDFSEVLKEVDEVLGTDSFSNDVVNENDMDDIKKFDTDLYYKIMLSSGHYANEYFDSNNPPQLFFKKVYDFCLKSYPTLSKHIVYPELVFSNSFGKAFYCTQFAKGDYEHYIFVPFSKYSKTEEIKTVVIEYFACMVSGDWKYGKKFKQTSDILLKRFDVKPDWGKGFPYKDIKSKSRIEVNRIGETIAVDMSLKYIKQERQRVFTLDRAELL